MAKAKFTYDYPRPMVTVDVIILSRDSAPNVLLIQRRQDPFAGCWAIPGGYLEMNESLEDAARRELFEETGVAAGKLVQLHTFGSPHRDPRGRTITVAYLAFVDGKKMKPIAADDARAVGWFPLHRPPALAFDHREILAVARRHVKALGQKQG